jgi:aminoglycoside phosphotransferase
LHSITKSSTRGHVRRLLAAHGVPLPEVKQMTPDQEAAREWLVTRKVIADALIEWNFATDREDANKLAAAIIARLAHHDPMIVTKFAGATAKRIVARIRAEAAQMGEVTRSFIHAASAAALESMADKIESEEV